MTTPVIVSDMDGTLTTAETWRGVLAWIRANHPSAAARRFVPLRVPVVLAMRAGLIAREPFRDRWLLDQARLLRGLPAAAAAEMGEWVVETSLWPARCVPAIAALGAAVADARAADPAARLILASASYQPIVEAFGRRVRADLVLGTPLEFRDGRATGALTAPVQSGQHKAAAVRSATSGQDVLVAFGDSGADVALLELARRAVAVAPDAALRRVAAQRGWEILEASA